MAWDFNSTMSAVETEVANALGFGHVRHHSEAQHEAMVAGALAAIGTWSDISDDDPAREPRTPLETACAAFIDAHDAREAAA